jgi:hypothetical protein
MAISMGMQVAWLLEHGKQYPKNFLGIFFEANPLPWSFGKKPLNLRRKAAKLASCDHPSLSLSLQGPRYQGLHILRAEHECF